jgi:hypothetical protein
MYAKLAYNHLGKAEYGYMDIFYILLFAFCPTQGYPIKVSSSNSSHMCYSLDFRNGSTKIPCKCISLHAHDSIAQTSFVHH